MRSPRLLMSRRMKIAATVRIGTMNSEIDAPSGMSPPSMPSLNAQVANMWVRSMGPPAVRMRTMSKFAKVTMSENSVVMAMMFRIIGRVTYQSFWNQLEPPNSQVPVDPGVGGWEQPQPTERQQARRDHPGHEQHAAPLALPLGG